MGNLVIINPQGHLLSLVFKLCPTIIKKIQRGFSLHMYYSLIILFLQDIILIALILGLLISLPN